MDVHARERIGATRTWLHLDYYGRRSSREPLNHELCGRQHTHEHKFEPAYDGYIQFLRDSARGQSADQWDSDPPADHSRVLQRKLRNLQYRKSKLPDRHDRHLFPACQCPNPRIACRLQRFAQWLWPRLARLGV